MKKSTLIILVILILIVSFLGYFLLKIFSGGPRVGGQALDNIYIVKIKDSSYFDYVPGAVKWNVNRTYEDDRAMKKDVVPFVLGGALSENSWELNNGHYLIGSFIDKNLSHMYFGEDIEGQAYTFVLFKFISPGDTPEYESMKDEEGKTEYLYIDKDSVILVPFSEVYYCGPSNKYYSEWDETGILAWQTNLNLWIDNDELGSKCEKII